MLLEIWFSMSASHLKPGDTMTMSSWRFEWEK
jgi:hypothetical protein